MIRFRLKLVNIRTGKDPYELHLFVDRTDKEELSEMIVNKDFRIKAEDSWLVSSNIDSAGAQWFVKGCVDEEYREGKRRYYNEKEKRCYYKKHFNNDLLSKFKDLKNFHEGEYDPYKNELRIIPRFLKYEPASKFKGEECPKMINNLDINN